MYYPAGVEVKSTQYGMPYNPYIPYNDGRLGGAGIVAAAVIAGLAITAYGVYSYERGRNEKILMSIEDYRQMLSTNLAPIRAIGIVNKWDKVQREYLLRAAFEYHKNVVVPNTPTNKPAIIFTDKSGEYVCVAQRPVDIVTSLASGDGVVDWSQVDAILADASGINAGSKGFFNANVSAAWRNDIQLIRQKVESGQATFKAEKLRKRPIWALVDSVVIGGAVLTAAIIAYKLWKNHKSRSTASNPSGVVTQANIKGSLKPSVDKAIRSYEGFHWGKSPEEVLDLDYEDAPDVVHTMGQLAGIAYVTKKGKSGEDVVYIHEFKPPYAHLATSPERRGLYIMGGGYKIEDRGIVN